MMIGNELIRKKIVSNELDQNSLEKIFHKIDELNQEELSNILIFKEGFNWKSSLLPILNMNFSLNEIFIFYQKLIKLGDRFNLKDIMPPRLYSAHLNYYYGVVVEQAIREIKRKDIEKGKNISSESSFDYIDNEIFNFLYGNTKLKLWREYALNFRIKSKSYYVPSKFYYNESENFDYWLSKKRIFICTRELNASLLSRGVKYLRGSGIYE